MRRAGRAVAVVVLALAVGTASASTVAYWRFEEGTAGLAAATGVDIPDSSGNGNHLRVASTTAYEYSDLVAWPMVPQTGGASGLSWRSVSAAAADASSTFSSLTSPTGIDAEVITPLAWTVEATIKVEATGAPRCFVGRDSHQLAPAFSNQSSFYMIINPSNTPGVRIVDMAGNYYALWGRAGMIQCFDGTADPDGLQVPWYHVAAVSDGTTLSLWVAEEGQSYERVGQMPLTGADTRLSAGTGQSGTGWHGGAWTVGRAKFGGALTDRGRGFVDEVRISDEALPVEKFLGFNRLAAWNPSPADGADKVPGTVTFEWDVPVNPANPAEVHPQLSEQFIYLQKTPTDPNWAAAVSAAVAGVRGSYGPVAIGSDVAGYRWKIETVFDDDPVEPNRAMSEEWTFSTMPSVPVIVSEPSPRGQAVEGGTDATITIEVESISAVEYAWKQVNPGGEDIAVGANSPELTIAGVTEDAHYYCVLTNSGGAVESEWASVGVARPMSHWPLDGDYLDVSGEDHDADPNGVPTFIAGADGTAGGAVQIDTQNGWATAGTWNPSEYTHELTVSFWLRWGGTNGTWQTFIAKRDGGFGAATALWQVSTAQNQDDLWFEAPGYQVAANDVLVSGEWQHIVATYDGSTGRLFHNGVLASSAAMVLGEAVETMISLGGDSGGAFPFENFTNGALDDVRIYNYAASEVEVAGLYYDVSGEGVCVVGERPDGAFDFDGNCVVDLLDFGTFAQQWLKCGLYPECLR